MGMLNSLFSRGNSAVADVEETATVEIKYVWKENQAPPPVEEPTDEDDGNEIAPYGEQALGLTRFGDVWINLSLIEGVDFNPQDGCAAEVIAAGHVYHLYEEDANALEKFLMETAKGRTTPSEAHIG